MTLQYFRGYSSGGCLLDALRVYFVLSLGVICIVTSKLIKGIDSVVRFYYYDIHTVHHILR